MEFRFYFFCFYSFAIKNFWIIIATCGTLNLYPSISEPDVYLSPSFPDQQHGHLEGILGIIDDLTCYSNSSSVPLTLVVVGNASLDVLRKMLTVQRQIQCYQTPTLRHKCWVKGKITIEETVNPVEKVDS